MILQANVPKDKFGPGVTKCMGSNPTAAKIFYFSETDDAHDPIFLLYMLSFTMHVLRVIFVKTLLKKLLNTLGDVMGVPTIARTGVC